MDHVASANPLLDLCSLIEETLLIQDDPVFLDEGEAVLQSDFVFTALSPQNCEKPTPPTPLQKDVEDTEQPSREDVGGPSTHRKARRNASASASRSKK